MYRAALGPADLAGPFTEHVALPHPLTEATALCTSDGVIYIAGGDTDKVPATAAVYSLQAGRWTEQPSMIQGRRAFTLNIFTENGADTLLAAGGLEIGRAHV